MPKWARGHRVPPRVVVGAVVRSVEAVHQRPVLPDRCATDAKHVVSLQRATMTPWEELADDIALVARWARECADPLAENDIRGPRSNGEQWGVDRSRNVSTIRVQARWSDRLEAARRWEAGTGPPAARTRGGEHSSLLRPEPTAAELAERDPHLWDPL